MKVHVLHVQLQPTCTCMCTCTHIPLVLEDVKADGSSDRANVWMPDLGHKLYLIREHAPQ